MKPIRFRSLLWRLVNKIWPTLAAKLKVALLGHIRLSIQFQTEHQAVIDYVTLVQPPIWKSINVVNPEFLAKVAAANPDALGIYRAHPNSYWADDPERRAAEHIGRIAAEIRYVDEYFHIVEDNNEYVFPFDSPERIEAADRYMAKFIELCSTVLGKKPLVLNASTGNWGDDIGEFVLTLDALWRFGGYIGFHEYDFRTMWRAHEEGLAEGNEGMWHCLRWKRAARTIKQLYDGWCPKFIISEAGIDSGAKPDEIPQRGFRGVHPNNLDASVENYVSSLRWYYDRLDDDVFAVTLFGCGMTAPWDGPEGFDIKDTAVPHRISLFPTEEPPEPPPPEPPKEDPMDIRIFDRFGNELLGADAEEMVALHGLSWEMPPALSVGDRYFKLVELREKPSSSLSTKVLDLYGNPIVNPDEWMDRSLAHRALWWLSIGSDADDIKIRFGTDHHEKADLGGLNENGEGGSGMGRGAYHDPYTPGPHECWVRHPDVWSMKVNGQGMLGATDHLHLDMLFQETVYTGDNGEEPPVPPGDLVAAVNRVGDELAGIRRWLEGETPEPPEPPPPLDTAFFGQYYNNTTLSEPPALERWDETIDFRWGSGSPGPGIGVDHFSVRWTATKTFAADTYRFKVRVDDGFRLLMDGIPIFDSWKDQPPTDYTADVTLAPGQHEIVVEYYEQAGDSTIEVSWKIV